MRTLRVEHWDPSWGELNEANMRRRLEQEGFRVNRYDYPPGTCFSEHTHGVDKKDTVLRGRLKIGSGDFEAVEETVVSLDATRIPRR